MSSVQLKEKGYTNVDALDGSTGMIEYAKSRNIYKQYIRALLGPQPIERIPKGNIFHTVYFCLSVFVLLFSFLISQCPFKIHFHLIFLL